MADRTFGAVPNKPDARDYRVAKLVKPGSINLPKSIDLSNLVPAVLDQGSEGTCAGHTMASVMHAMETSAKRAVRVSPRWAYEKARTLQPVEGEGATLRSIYKAAQKFGVCQSSDWPYVANYKGTPGEGASASAADNRIASYAVVGVHPLRVKEALVFYRTPLGVVIEVREGFMMPDQNGFVSGGDSTNNYHAITVVGYDDDRKAFKVLNSWGTYWGPLGGYAWYPYDLGFVDVMAAVPNLGRGGVPRPWYAFLMPWVQW